MLSIKQLKQAASEGDIDTVIAAFPDHYGRLMGKRLTVDYFLDHYQQGIGACNYLLTVDMEMEPVAGYDFANWEKGYGDFLMAADIETLRIASWLDKTAIVLCDLVDDKNSDLIRPAPRTILKNLQIKAKDLGFQVMAASELEYYLYQDTYQQAHEKNYHNLKALGWYIEDYHILQGTREESFNGLARRHLQASDIPVENSKGEFGLGQHELNVCYADVLAMADRHVLYKQCLKELAEQLGISVTFMAKVDEQQAGSSCHIHISLWKNGSNAFAGNQEYAGIQCSDTFRWFLGGWLHNTPQLMPFFAPTINAYKRYQDASWAPTRLAWSVDNRTAGFRIIGHGDSLRIECRIAGADCNPYLAFAAALAAGLHGIEHQIEPPEVHKGDVYADNSLPSIPTTLQQATNQLSNSQLAKQYLGDDVLTHYAHFYQSEQQAYDKAVTDWERRRYFERI